MSKILAWAVARQGKVEEAEELLGSPPLAMDFLLIHHIFHGKPIGFNVVVF
jgi:hypothetical protein